MFDLIRFDINEINDERIHYYDVRKLEKSFFQSSSDVQKARAIVKRVRYFHFQDYTAEQGLIIKMKENGCKLVVAVDDFLSVSNEQMVRILSRARNLVYIARKNGVGVKIFSLAKDEYGLRDEYEMYRIAVLVGLEKEYIERMIEEEAEI